MAPAPSLLLTGTPNPLLHLLSAVTASASDMDSPVGDESPSSQAALSTSPPPRPTSRPMPVREDCWSEEATETLIEAWGDRYVDLNKGNLRRKHWQEVADAVNAAHGHTKKTRRTDIQCKNRIDTIKKKYKVEKAKALDSRGAYVSPWPFFIRVDSLIGDTAVKKFTASTPSPVVAASGGRPRGRSTVPSLSSSPSRALALTPYVPVGPRSLKPKRPAAMDDSFFRRTFAAAAAAASKTEDDEDENEREEPETSRSSGAGSRRRDGGGCRQLAEAIMMFGEIYERVEGMKQEQLIELEKHRMELAKELEFQRIKLLTDTQLQLAKIKRIKPSSDADADSY